jgi:pre-rRNA-processing protein TSR2
MHPNKANFIEGVRLLLSNWPTLRTAVLEEWGGHQSQEKADWLVDSIVEHFDERGKRIDQEELEDIFLDVMAREFNVLLEDQSERSLAAQLLVLFQQSVKGETALLVELRARVGNLHKAESRIEDSDESGGDEGDDSHCIE